MDDAAGLIEGAGAPKRASDYRSIFLAAAVSWTNGIFLTVTRNPLPNPPPEYRGRGKKRAAEPAASAVAGGAVEIGIRGDKSAVEFFGLNRADN